MKNDQQGIYVHFPFCLRKCPYCDFVSYPVLANRSDHRIDEYVNTLKKEVSLRRRWLDLTGAAPRAFHSLYIGGGTPSILTTKQLTELLETIRHSFSFTPEAEVTLEANPGTVTDTDFATWRKLGINRLSLGVQSLDDSLLAQLGRIHTAEDVYEAVKGARDAGFANLSFDLILGLPGQSLDHWQESLVEAASLHPQHMSCYELTIEPDTEYGRLNDKGKLYIPSEDVVIAMLEWTSQYLTDLGYIHYEISNYALPGFKSRHNQIYWQNRQYLGLGVAAFSYWGHRRWGNTANLQEYREEIAVGRLPEGTTETLDVKDRMGETVMLGLRLAEGVSLANLRARFGISVWDVWEEEIHYLLSQGLLELARGRLRLTPQGLLLANQVQSVFLG